MDYKQCTSDDLNHSPYSNQGFQADRFTKKTNHLSIPDTILENCSGELSGESLKVEAPKINMENANSDDNKENINSNQQVINNEPLNVSPNSAFNYSYIIRCEKNLLENSYSDEENNLELANKSVLNRHLLEVQSKSALHNNTMSTPPSTLRKEISMLRSEMAEAHEFHDLEIQLLKEEKSVDIVDSEKYLELFEKYSTLVDLYANLKTEYDELRKKQENMRNELQSKTADYLESLCSQIETSDNSLNFSSSFVSFSGGVKSSTMMEGLSEVEATVMHDGTVLANDPLSITGNNENGVFKTPLQTPLRSSKKLFPQELTSSVGKSTIKEAKDFTLPLDSEYNIQLLNLETTVYDKVKEVEDLEQRLFKVEDMSVVLHSEFERIASVYEKQNSALKHDLSVKTEQLTELTQKLFTETISLNPSIKDSLLDIPATKLLEVFIETIMENCKKIKNDDHLTMIENLQSQLSSQEAKLLELEELRRTCEDLKARLSDAVCTISIEGEITSPESNSTFEKIQIENENLKERISESEKLLSELKMEMETVKKHQTSEVEELLRKVDMAKKESSGFSKTLENVEKGQKNLVDVLSDVGSDSDLPSDRITKLIQSTMSLHESFEAREAKIMSVFIDTITKACKEVQNELIRSFDIKKLEWEAQRKLDVDLIKNLEEQIKCLEGKSQENETKIREILLEKEDLIKLHENLKNQMTEAEKTISTCTEEIKALKSHKDVMKKAKDDLFAAEELIKQLNTQLSALKTEKLEAEQRCLEVEANLHAEINAKETIIKETQEVKLQAEHRCRDLEKRLEAETNAKHETVKESEELKGKLENSVKLFESQLTEIKEKLASAEETILKLQSLLQSIQIEKSEVEIQCAELQKTNKNLQEEIISARNFENNPAYESIQLENDILKQKLSDCEKLMDKLKSEVDVARENQTKNCLKTEELIREIEELKKENSEFSQALVTLEETQKKLEDVLSEIGNNSELPIDRMTELIQNTSTLNEPSDSRQKIVAIFVQTITKMCKELQNELIRKFDSKQIEWEAQRNIDLDLIKSLNGQVKLFEEKSQENDAKIKEIVLEKEDLMNLHENFKKQMTDAERIISECREEIGMLRSQEVAIKKTKEDISAADELIAQLNSQLSALKTEKFEAEKRCCELEERLQAEIERKQAIMKESEELKIVKDKLESENGDLRQQILGSEETVGCLEKILEVVRSEQAEREQRIKDLEGEIEFLKNEGESFGKRLDKLEANNKRLRDVLSDVQFHLEIPEDTLVELLSGNFDNKKIFKERIDGLIKTERELFTQQTNQNELDELRKSLEAKLLEAKIAISAKEEELRLIQSSVKETREEFACTKAALSRLESQMESVETQRKDIETRCRDLEAFNDELKREIENLRQVLSEKMEIENNLKEKYEALRNQMIEAESVISKRDEEISELKSKESSLENQLRELKNTCENLEEKLLKTEDINRDLEAVNGNLKSDIDTSQNLEKELQTKLLSTLEKMSETENENARLKDLCDSLKAQMTEAENLIFTREEEIRALKSYESQYTAIKENLVSADETILKLKSQLKSIENEKSEVENRCTELQESNKNLREEITSAKNLNPAYENIQNENYGLKQRVLEYEKMMSDLKSDLDAAKENQRNNTVKVEELVREIEELKRENTGLSNAFVAIEETQKNLADVLSEVGNDSDLPGDRVTKVIAKTTKASDTRETKIVSQFVETVSKTCKGVQNELIKKFDSKKLEWETQRDVDLQNLQDEIKLLTEKNVQHEALLKQAKDELTEADVVVQKLKFELSTAQAERLEIESRCRKLEEGALSLQAEIDTKETIIKGLDELKIVREKLENENGDLKKQIIESEEVVVRLKKCLKIAQDEQTDRELRIKDFESEITCLKKEREILMGMSGKLKDLEKNHKSLMDVLSDVQLHLDLPEDTLKKLLSDELKNKKIFIERINGFIATQMDGLRIENKNLKLGNDSLKERVRQLTKIIEETTNTESKEDLANISASYLNGMSLRNRSGKKIDRCARRLDKLEEINHNLTELLIRILTTTEYPDLEKLDLSSVANFPKTMKKVVAHLNGFVTNLKELKEENSQLDEECETYSNIIKDLKKEAVAVWKSNSEKTEAMEREINWLKEEKSALESEKEDLLAKISKLDAECQKLQSAAKLEGSHHSCSCGNDSKKINELKRTILMKEQKLLELQDLEAQSSSLKSQIEYLKTALEREKKKTAEEKEKNKKLENQLNEAIKKEKTEKKKEDDNHVLEELRMRGSISGGIVQEFGDKEKMRKLSKDIGILKELCRARYAEIKRLEAVNAALRNGTPKHPSTPKNSNQMDSPIRSRGYNTRSKNQIRDVWKSEIIGKENNGL